MNVSIIVPVYNAQKDLHRCVNSILKQTVPCNDIILVDDGSSDSSPEICDEFASINPSIRVFHTPNRGVSSARNFGIDVAREQWIMFVDSDDFLPENAIANFLSNSSGVDLVISEWAYRQHTGNTLYETRATDNTYVGQNNIVDTILTLDHVHWCVVWNKLYKKSIIDKYNLRFDTSVTIEEDLLFNWQYVIHANAMRSISQVSYFYCGNPGSAVCRKHSFVSYDTKMRSLDCVFNSIQHEALRNKVKTLYLKSDLKVCDSLYYDRVDKTTRFITLKWLKDKMNILNISPWSVPGKYNKLILLGLKSCYLSLVDPVLRGVLGFRNRYN